MTDLGPKRIGTVNGTSWWTNGSIMVKGKLRTSKDASYPEQRGMQRVYEEATAGTHVPLVVGKERPYGNNADRRCVALGKDGEVLCFIDKIYFDFLKDVEWFAGAEIKRIQGTSRYAIAKKGDEVFAIVAPVAP